MRTVSQLQFLKAVLEKPYSPVFLINMQITDDSSRRRRLYRAVGAGGGRGELGGRTPQILEDPLTLFKPGGLDYAYHITNCPPPGCSTLPTALG